MNKQNDLQKIEVEGAVTTVSDVGTNDLFRGGVPLGGIGTGKIELCPDGAVTNITTNCNVEAPICNGYAAAPAKVVKGGVPGIFWALWDESGAKVLKTDPVRGLPGVSISNMKYEARLPIGEITYTDIGNIDVHMTAYSPFIVGDTSDRYRDSAIPGVIFTFKLTNVTKSSQKYRFMYSWQNMIGITGYYNLKGWGVCDTRGNQVTFRKDEKYPGAHFTCDRLEKKDPRGRGEYSLRINAPENATIEYREWRDAGQLWEQFAGNLPLKDDNWFFVGADAVVSAAGELAAGESDEIKYAISWYFPDLVEENDHNANYGRSYQNFFKDSWEVGKYLLENDKRLYSATTEWQQQIFNSNLPEWFKYKMLDDLFPIISNSWYTKEGLFSISEAPSGMGGMMGTIDQRNSSQAPYLLAFPKLCRAELDIFRANQAKAGNSDEYGRHWDFSTGTSPEDYLINQTGAVPHDIGHDDLRSSKLVTSSEWNSSHWPDLQSGYILQWYAYFCWINDPSIRQEVYESVKLTESFLRRLDANNDCVPDLWGSGSSSYDNRNFPYYGISPYCTTLYLAALAAMEKMANQMGESDYAKDVALRRETAYRTLVRENWNGSYFKCWTHKEHESWDNGPRKHASESNSIHISQLAGQWYASMMGLGYIVEPEKVALVLETIANNNHSIVTGAAPVEVWQGGPGEKARYNESWPHYAEVYFASLAIYESQKDVGMDELNKYWKVILKNNARWDFGLCIEGPQNDEQMGGRWYMSNTAGWFCMLALAGVWVDLPAKQIMIAPNLPPSFGNKLESIPVLTEKYWLAVSREEMENGFVINLNMNKNTGDALVFESIKTRAPLGTEIKSIGVKINGALVTAPFSYDNNTGYVIINTDLILEKVGDNIIISIQTY